MIFFVYSLSCCEHSPEPPVTPCKCGEGATVAEIRDWAFFDVGSYWIYEEETTLARDTFTVLSAQDIVQGQEWSHFQYETVRSLDSYNYTFWYNESWAANCPTRDCCVCNPIWCMKQRPGDADGSEKLFKFPGFVGNYTNLVVGQDVGISEITEVLDSYCVSDDLCFDNVIVFQNTLSVLDQSDVNDDYYNVKYYFGKSIGIVRKEIQQTNQIWNLVDYHIHQ